MQKIKVSFCSGIYNEEKNEIEFPKELKKYQEQAYLTALCNL